MLHLLIHQPLNSANLMKRLTEPAPSGLLILIAINILVSLGHYVHNMVFLPQYHEPAWITPALIDSLWLVMTPLGVIGYGLYRRGYGRWGYGLLYFYCGLSLLVLGHYVITPIASLSLTIHLVILAEALVAAMLAVYVAYLQKLNSTHAIDT